MNTYRYILSIDDASPQIVTPIVGDAQVFEFRKEPDQVFFRKSLSGDELIFCNNDYDIIDGADFGAKFTIDMFKLNEFDLYVSVFIGVFYKTDCNFDADAKQVVVQPTPQDAYKKVMEGMDREFNLIELAPPTIEIDHYKQPVFQLITVKDASDVGPVMTNVIGSISFEQEFLTPPVGGGDLLINYEFGTVGAVATITGEVGMNPDISGQYYLRTGIGGAIRTSDEKYIVKRIDPGGANDKLVVEEVASGAVVYQALPPGDGSLYDGWILTSLTTGHTAKYILRSVYGRYLTNEDEVLGVSTVDIPTNDIVSNPPGYTKCLPIGSGLNGYELSVDGEEVLVAYNGHQVDPTPYPKIPDTETFFAGEYLTRPDGYETGKLVPIDRGRWGQASFWFAYNATLEGVQETGSELKTQFNAYKLSDALNAVLTALDTNLTFDSDFFTNPANPIRDGLDATPIIIPKSNVIVGEYSQPAQRAPIKLSEIMNLYWGFYKCKWHIEGTKLMVEHIEYYQNGKSYDGPNVGADLTSLTEKKTGLPWAYKANTWEYDKSKIPGQLRFSWMDKVSLPFDGYPIDVLNNYAEQGDVEDIDITLFTSDIDYIQLAPDNVSKEGFFFGEAVIVGGRFVIPFVTINVGGTGSYKVQNGYASLFYAHDKYHRHSLPGSDVRLNLEAITAISQKRIRIQKIELPGGIIDDDSVMTLITTNLGSGLLRSLKDNTNGSGASVEIEHDI